MKDYGDSSPVRMVIDLVGPVATIKREAVADRRGNDFASGDIPQPGVVDTHGSDRDGNARLYGDLHFVGGFLWNAFAVLKDALHNQMDESIDVLHRFCLCGAPG